MILDAKGGEAFLSNNLLSKLHKALVATPTPNAYQEYCFLLQTVSYNLQAIKSCEIQSSKLS
jgi:hypothetical protein